MSKHEVAALACKILAVYFFAQALINSVFLILWPVVSMPLAMNSSGSILSTVAPGLIQALAHVVVGLALWHFAPSISDRMIS